LTFVLSAKIVFNIFVLTNRFTIFSVFIVFTIITCALLQTFLGIFGTVLINSDVGTDSINGTIPSPNSNSQIEQFFTKYILGSHSFVAALLDDTFWLIKISRFSFKTLEIIIFKLIILLFNAKFWLLIYIYINLTISSI
jgi:hypothetical protein